jgi:hypothetical protein
MLRLSALLIGMIALFLPGCSAPEVILATETALEIVLEVTPTANTSLTYTQILSPSITPLPTQTAAATLTPTNTPTPTRTPILTPTRTPTNVPSQTPAASSTPVFLRGQVLMLSNCRYGPGAAYLYKYALIEGSNLEIIGRDQRGGWLLVRAIGGTNPCWVNASLMDVKGEIQDLSATTLPLPMSPYYGPLTGASAERSGSEVTISWHPLVLRAGDDSEQYLYLVEAWLCQDGELVFTPLGSYQTTIKVTDEAGCPEPSHGRVYGVEKHGYTRWIEIPWP